MRDNILYLRDKKMGVFGFFLREGLLKEKGETAIFLSRILRSVVSRLALCGNGLRADQESFAITTPLPSTSSTCAQQQIARKRNAFSRA